MDRRASIKTLIAATGGLVALPAWAEGWSSDDVGEGSSYWSVSEQDTLSGIADTIIPAGSSIGALSVGVDKFLQKLLENCYEADVRDNVKRQLGVLDASAMTAFQINYAKCNQASRESLLLKFANSTTKEEKDFFDLIKAETIRGFNTSKEVMLGYFKYKMVPGHYYGCVDITT